MDIHKEVPFAFQVLILKEMKKGQKILISELGGFRRRGVDRCFHFFRFPFPNRMTYLILVLYLETLDSHCSKFCLTLNPRTGDWKDSSLLVQSLNLTSP